MTKKKGAFFSDAPFFMLEPQKPLSENLGSVVFDLGKVSQGVVHTAHPVGVLAGLFPDNFSVVSSGSRLLDSHILDNECA